MFIKYRRYLVNTGIVYKVDVCSNFDTNGTPYHSAGGIPLCILIIPECFAQNLKGRASADLSPFCRNSFVFEQKTHLLSTEICICVTVIVLLVLETGLHPVEAQ